MTCTFCANLRVRFLFDLLAEALMRHAGIQLHQGKTRVWNRSGTLPDDVDTLGDEVWRSDGIKELASWADALHMIHERTPNVADIRCVAELKQATDRLDKEGFWWRPSWSALRDGKRPPEITARDPGEWPHGWQYWASSISDSHFQKCSLLSGRAAAHRAHLRSHSGWNAGAAIAFAPLESLQLPLTVTEVVCEGCQAPLDAHGRHSAACPRSGRSKKRATPIERVLAHVCREAGARVTFNAFLRDMNVGVPASDGRRIEVFAQDLPCYAGTQLAIDITLRALLTSAGEAHPGAADTDGAVLIQARRDKETTYPELAGGRCKLVVVGIETGGRWAEEGVE